MRMAPKILLHTAYSWYEPVNDKVHLKKYAHSIRAVFCFNMVA